MNPFVVFLLLVPLLASAILIVGAAFSLFTHGPRWDIITAFAILCVICGSLIVLLRRTSRSSLLEFPGSERVDVPVRKKLTVFTLAIIYVTLALMVFLLINIESLRNWIGLFCFLLGLLLCYSGTSQLKQEDTPQSSQSTESIASQVKMLEISLSSHAMTRNLLLVSLILMGFFAVILYRILDIARYFSLLDLLGFLFFGSTLWLWFTLNGVSRQRKLQALRGQLRQARG